MRDTTAAHSRPRLPGIACLSSPTVLPMRARGFLYQSYKDLSRHFGFCIQLQQGSLSAEAVRTEHTIYPGEDGLWYVDSGYMLPETNEQGTVPGYDAGWVIDGSTSVLTTSSKVTGWPDDTLKVTIENNSIVSKPMWNSR